MSSKFIFKTQYIVYATPEQVFEALTDPGIVGAWGGGLSVVEQRIGGKFEWFDGWVSGEVFAFKPGQELGFTWKPTEWSKKTPHSEVLIKLKNHQAGTDLVLFHTNLPSEDEVTKAENGWIDEVFDPLNDYFTLPKS